MTNTTSPSALITGSSRGIGIGIARRLAQRGFGLTIAGRDASRLIQVAAELRQTGAADVVTVAGDVLDDAHLAALVDRHRQRYTSLNALIVNAGAGSAGALADFHVKRFDKQIATNLRAAYVLIQAALPVLRSAAVAAPDRGAKVIAMASLTGIYPERELAAYGAAKAALIALCNSVNLEENALGVQATAIAPGYVDT